MLYPRGDQTSSLSVYLECSAEPYNDADSEQEIGAADGSERIREAEDEKAGAAIDAPGRTLDLEGRDTDPSIQESPSSPNSEGEEVPWEVAAQFGVVLYNPAEPRVQYNFKEEHQFWNGNDDFGRKYFHGPWTEIHLRQRGQRQALLRNDTLALTAYIRIVKDPTGSLWWRQRDEGPSWNNQAKTGLRGLFTRMEGEGFFTAGMAAWLYLPPFQDLVYGFHAPTIEREPFARPKPLFAALQRVLYLLLHQHPRSHTVDLTPIVEALKGYGIDFRAKIDTLEAWEIIRWKMEQEAEGTETKEQLAKLFGHVVTPGRELPDGTSMSEASILDYPCVRIPARDGGSIQEHLNKHLEIGNNICSKIIKAAPKLLQIELERQVFEEATRKWRKVDDRVVLNEKLEFPQQTVHGGSNLTYSLYGMIVHRGSLQSGLYYLVMRPGGPKTKWYRFYGERDGYQIQCITRKQAIRAHEGFHEGERDEETAAVAYLVMYLRDDVFNDEADERSGRASRWLSKFAVANTFRLKFFCNALLTERSSIDHVVRSVLEDRSLILPPSDQDNTTNVEVDSLGGKPGQEQTTFRVFHHDVFKGHQGQGYIDLYDSRWSGQSDYVCNITLDAQATWEELQQEALSRMRQTEESEQTLIFSMSSGRHPRTIQTMPRLRSVDLGTKVEAIRSMYPLTCLWLVNLPSRKFQKH